MVALVLNMLKVTKVSLSKVVLRITDAIKSEIKVLGIDAPEIGIEPGRSIVGEAGVTLYEVGSR